MDKTFIIILNKGFREFMREVRGMSFKEWCIAHNSRVRELFAVDAKTLFYYLENRTNKCVEIYVFFLFGQSQEFDESDKEGSYKYIDSRIALLKEEYNKEEYNNEEKQGCNTE